jgi:hypothetical protein
MKTIELSAEQIGVPSLRITVRKKDYKFLKMLQYQGGFKRFGLTVYENKVKGIYTEQHALSLSRWLHMVFLRKLT